LKAGDSVTQGTTVMVIISKGPAPRSVPDLTGKSLEEATAILEDMGLVVFKGDDVFSPDVPVGMVAAFTPPKDTQVTIGDTVTVNLSKGPDLVTLPPVTGLDYNGIIAALQNAGFTIGRVNGNVALQFLSYSVNGVPATAGQQFPRGTAVELFFKTS
jgi:serine/threonine-protein kinase